MNQETYNLWYLIAQVVIGGVIVWYTVETFKLRKQGREQLDLLHLQFQRSVAPYIFSGFRTREIASFGRSCTVWNPTDRPAHDISVFVFDGIEYFSSLRCIDTLGQTDMGEAEDIPANGPLSAEEAFEKLLIDYPDCSSQIVNRLKNRETPYLAVLYRDINGELYLAVRTTTFDSARNAQLAARNFVLYPDLRLTATQNRE